MLWAFESHYWGYRMSLLKLEGICFSPRIPGLPTVLARLLSKTRIIALDQGLLFLIIMSACRCLHEVLKLVPGVIAITTTNSRIPAFPTNSTSKIWCTPSDSRWDYHGKPCFSADIWWVSVNKLRESSSESKPLRNGASRVRLFMSRVTFILQPFAKR